MCAISMTFSSRRPPEQLRLCDMGHTFGPNGFSIPIGSAGKAVVYQWEF